MKAYVFSIYLNLYGYHNHLLFSNNDNIQGSSNIPESFRYTSLANKKTVENINICKSFAFLG